MNSEEQCGQQIVSFSMTQHGSICRTVRVCTLSQSNRASNCCRSHQTTFNRRTMQTQTQSGISISISIVDTARDALRKAHRSVRFGQAGQLSTTSLLVRAPPMQTSVDTDRSNGTLVVVLMVMVMVMMVQLSDQ